MFITRSHWQGTDSVNPLALLVKPIYDTPPPLAHGNGTQVIYSDRGPPFYGDNDLGEYICHGDCVPMCNARSASPGLPDIALEEHSKSACIVPTTTWRPEIQSGELEATNLQIQTAMWTATDCNSSQAPETKSCGYITNTHLKITMPYSPTSAVAGPSSRNSINALKVSSSIGLGSQDGRTSAEDIQDANHNPESSREVEIGPNKGRVRRSGSIYAGKPADEIDVEDEEIPYAQLIYKALMSVSTRTMVLSEIYQYFREKIPRFSKMRSKGWQNSIRHNLSMNGAFHKVERPLNQDGVKRRGYYWVLTEEAEREGVKSTTRFRKNSATNRRKLSESSTSSNCSSSRRHRTRAARKNPSKSPNIHSETDQQSSSTSTTEDEVVSDSSPRQSEENGQYYDIMVSNEPSDSILSNAPQCTNSQLEAESNDFYNPHKSCDSAVVDFNNTWPAFSQSSHNLYESRQLLYDNENINGAFNEEFALIQSSQDHQETTFVNEALPPASLATNTATFALGLWLSGSGGGFW